MKTLLFLILICCQGCASMEPKSAYKTTGGVYVDYPRPKAIIPAESLSRAADPR